MDRRDFLALALGFEARLFRGLEGDFLLGVAAAFFFGLDLDLLRFGLEEDFDFLEGPQDDPLELLALRGFDLRADLLPDFCLEDEDFLGLDLDFFLGFMEDAFRFRLGMDFGLDLRLGLDADLALGLVGPQAEELELLDLLGLDLRFEGFDMDLLFEAFRLDFDFRGADGLPLRALRFGLLAELFCLDDRGFDLDLFLLFDGFVEGPQLLVLDFDAPDRLFGLDFGRDLRGADFFLGAD